MGWGCTNISPKCQTAFLTRPRGNLRFYVLQVHSSLVCSLKQLYYGRKVHFIACGFHPVIFSFPLAVNCSRAFFTFFLLQFFPLPLLSTDLP